MKVKTLLLKKGLAVLLMASLVISANLHAEDVKVIKAGILIDVIAGKLLSNQIIVIKKGVITQVGSSSTVDIPAGAEVIDLSQSTVMPGMMDSHVHLTARHDKHGYRGLADSIPRTTLYGVPNAYKTLQAGFTTVRNVGAEGYGDIALRDAINDGEVIGPRIIAGGPSLGMTGGHCDNNLLPSEYHSVAEGVADGPWALRAKVREVIKYGADVIKFCGTGGVLSKGTQVGARQFTLEEMKALVDEAHTRGRKVAVHAHGADGIRTAIEAGVDSVEHASFIDAKSIKLAKKKGIYLSMDIYVSDYILSAGESAGILPESLAKERTVGATQRENFRKAVRAGVKMSLGTDAGVYPHGDNGKQLAYLVKYGMKPMQALQTATINTARLLGVDQETGAIVAGRAADIIAVPGNPVDDVRLLENVAFVMKAGKVYKRDHQPLPVSLPIQP